MVISSGARLVAGAGVLAILSALIAGCSSARFQKSSGSQRAGLSKAGPVRAPAAQRPAAAPVTPVKRYHGSPPRHHGGNAVRVARGDTLFAISRRTGVPVQALIDENRLTSPNLQPGQILRLPMRYAGP